MFEHPRLKELREEKRGLVAEGRLLRAELVEGFWHLSKYGEWLEAGVGGVRFFWKNWKWLAPVLGFTVARKLNIGKKAGGLKGWIGRGLFFVKLYQQGKAFWNKYRGIRGKTVEAENKA